MKSQSAYKLTPVAASIASILYPAQAVLAQESADPMLEEVIVTATLRAVNMQEVPQSITAMTMEDIQRNNLQSLDDLVRALPSLGLVTSQPGRNDLVYRGVSSGSAEYYTDSQVAVYLDQASITLISQQPWPQFVDIDHLESLPGPQGTLFGSASQTGTLRIITNKPKLEATTTGEVFGEISTTKGGDMGWRAEGWVNIPLSDSFAIRAVAYHVKEGGYIDNVLAHTYRPSGWDGLAFTDTNQALVEKDYNDWDLTGGRISALWEMTEDWTSTLSFITEDSTVHGGGDSDPYYGDFATTRFYDEFRDDTWKQGALNIEGDLGWAVFNSNTSYFDRDIKYEWDNMAYEQYKDSYWGNYYYYDLYNSNYTYGHIFNDQNQSRFAQEFRLTSQTESRFQWMVGLYYENVKDDWFYGSTNDQLLDTTAWYYAQYLAYYYNYYGYPVDYPLEPTNLAYTQRLDREKKQTSVFGEISYDITDKWTVVGGARWFKYDRYYFEQNQFPEGLPPPGSQATDGIFISEGKTNDTLFKASIQYQISDNKMVYVLYSEGFRLGGTNNLRAVETGEVPREYNPDKVKNFELGLKSQWLEDRLLLNISAYQMKWDEYQQNSTVDDIWWLRGTFNAADMKITGVELETTMLFTENFSANASVAYVDAKWDSFYEFPNGDQIFEGMPGPTSPKWKGFLGLDYTWPGAFGSDDVFIHYDFSFQAKNWNNLDSIIDQDPNGIIPSWNVSNFRLGTHLQNNWSITFYVRNLFDQKAISWLDSNNDTADWFGVPQGRNIRTYNRPRQMGLQVRKGWY